jgi:hypothetical protein
MMGVSEKFFKGMKLKGVVWCWKLLNIIIAELWIVRMGSHSQLLSQTE